MEFPAFANNRTFQANYKMMKKSHLIIILFLLTGHLKAQNLSIIDALHLNEELDYKARKPVRVIEKNISFNINDKETLDKIIKTFDKAGMLLTFEFYDGKDSLFARATYLNDTIHRIKLSRILEVRDKNVPSKETSIYTYDNNYFLKEVTDFDDNGIIIRKRSIFCNDKGHPVELLLFDSKGNFIAKERATYFYKTNKVIRTLETQDGQIINDEDSSKISLKNESSYQYHDEKYNSCGDRIRWKGKGFFDKDLIYEREYIYDNFGNWKESKVFLLTIQKDGQQYKKIKSIINREFTYQ
jgi:hypothetical protein